MHHKDADKTYREKDRRALHKNAISYIEELLKAISHETTAVRPLASYLKKHPIRLTRHAGHWWRCKDEHISGVLQ